MTDLPARRRSPLVTALLLGGAVALLVPLALFVGGLRQGRTDLVATAGLWWGVCLVLLLALPGSVDAAVGRATGRSQSTVGGFFRFVEAVLAALLPTCLFVAILPASTERTTVTLICLAGFVLTAWGAWSLRRRFVVWTVSLLFAGLLATVVFPDTTARLLARVEGWDARPHRVAVSVEDLDRGSIAFFDEGEPALWYHLRDDGTYEWFDRPGLHPVYNVPLAPATPEAVRAFEADLRADPKGNTRRRPPTGGTARVAASAGGALALRSEPAVNRGRRLARMPTGAVVRVEACLPREETIGAATGAWCRVTHEGTTGWAFGGYLEGE